MMKKSRKIISFFLFLCILFSLLVPVSATKSTPPVAHVDMNTVLDNYHRQVLEAKNQTQRSTAAIAQSIDDITEQAVKDLKAAGYVAYNVNASTFSAVENELNTDLRTMGLKADGSYIIIVHGAEECSTNTRSDYGKPASSFRYTYNGVLYTLRYLTVTGTHDPRFAKSYPVNLLESGSQSLIDSCLNGLVNLYFSSLSTVLGTILSMLPFDVSDLRQSNNASIVMHCGTNWTREYIQVWCDVYDSWVYGSCSEYVKATHHISGQYYHMEDNVMRSFSTPDQTIIRYSDRYYDYTWRKEHAIIGYLYSDTWYDTVGDVTYTHNGRTVWTHIENF